MELALATNTPIDVWLNQEDDRLISTAVAVLNEQHRKAEQARKTKGRRRA